VISENSDHKIILGIISKLSKPTLSPLERFCKHNLHVVKSILGELIRVNLQPASPKLRSHELPERSKDGFKLRPRCRSGRQRNKTKYFALKDNLILVRLM